MINISQDDFIFYRNLLQEKSGLSLAEDKAYLLTTRLSPIAYSLGYVSLEGFTRDLQKMPNASLIKCVVEAMTTNETSFFRDTKPFNALREMLPALAQSREKRKMIRIWSAACSSGQECYSLAILMKEFLADKVGWQCQIVGTDISTEMLTQARRGEYSQFEIQRGLPIQTIVKYFNHDGTVWRIKDEVRDMVSFQYANLMESNAALGTFDLIFCRNVLIYFNNQTKTDVLNRIGLHLAADGLLFLGACETTINLAVPFESVPGMHGILKPKSRVKVSA